MGIIKNLTFDGVSLNDYGVGITGAGVYNAPERDTEMIEIPGRSGEFVLDKKRFKNIEVTYPAGAYDNTQANFADKISDLRNQLASRYKYARLEDEYNPDEYRLALFKDGLEVDPVHYSRAGEFDIVFNCKPQRFLKSGETAQTVADGGTITNPTLFESKPLLLVTGYGEMTVNGDVISVEDRPIGDVILANEGVSYSGRSDVSWKPEYFHAGDTFRLYGYTGYASLEGTGITFDSVSFDTDGASGYMCQESHAEINSGEFEMKIMYSFPQYPDAFHIGSAWSIQPNATWTFTQNGNTITYSMSLLISYDGNHTLELRTAAAGVGSGQAQSSFWSERGQVIGESSVSALGEPLYIDLDIGEAYKYEDGVVISSDNGVSLPANLPTLKPGANTITYDNTVTDFKVIPRWWKI